jgi:hypothetical protein
MSRKRMPIAFAWSPGGRLDLVNPPPPSVPHGHYPSVRAAGAVTSP